jgi:MscS family membrane protein
MQVLHEWAQNAPQILTRWAQALDPGFVVLVVGSTVALILMRRPISAAATSVTALFLERLGLSLSPQMRDETRRTYASLIYILALLFALNALAPPAVSDGILKQLLVVLVLIVIYSALFRRADLLVELLLHREGKAGLDTIWISRVLQLVLIALCFASVTDVLGLDISGAVAGLGVFGAGLAIASQDFIRNLVAGMNSASEGRFGPGDWISTDKGVEGTVVSMDLRSTKIVGVDRVPNFVPNSDLANAVLRNHSRMDHRRVSLKIGLDREATDKSVEQVCRQLEHYAHSCGDFVVEEGVPLFAAPSGITNTALEIHIYLFTVTASFEEYTRACGRLALAVREAALSCGTDLAYPVSTVQLRESATQEAYK